MIVRALFFFFGPNRALVTARLGELKAAPARERENLFGNLTAEFQHAVQGLFQVGMIKHDQTASGGDGGALGLACEPATNPAVVEGRVVGSVISEFPTEQALEELPGGSKISSLKFDVVDLI